MVCSFSMKPKIYDAIKNLNTLESLVKMGEFKTHSVFKDAFISEGSVSDHYPFQSLPSYAADDRVNYEFKMENLLRPSSDCDGSYNCLNFWKNLPH